MRRGARPWQRSRSRRSGYVGVGLGVTVEVGVGVTVGLGVGVALGVGVGLGKHALTTSTKRATTCWFPWSGLDAGDEEATFILVSDYRAASEKLRCTLKNVHCFAERDSIRRQELHKNTARIWIGPPDQVNFVNGVERQARKTRPALSGYRYQGSYWFARSVNKLPKERLGGVKIGEHDQILIRSSVIGHTRGDCRAGKDVTDDKRICQRHAVAIQESALEIFVHLISPGREIIASGCIHSDFTRWSGRSGSGDGRRRRERCAIASNPPEVDSRNSATSEVACMVGELASDRVKYQRLLETSVGDVNDISNRNTRAIHERAKSVVEAIRAGTAALEPPGDKVLIGISIVGDRWFDKGICALYNRIVFTEKRAINRETLIIYSPGCANKLVPAHQEFVSLTVECGGGSIDRSDA